jgi:hypothetical protein
LKNKVKLRGPNDTEFEVGEGQAVAVKEDGSGVEVVDIERQEGARSIVHDDVRKALHDHVELVRSGNADMVNMMASLKDIMEMNSKRQTIVSGGGYVPRMDSMDAETYADLIDEVPTNDWARDVQDKHDKATIRFQARCAYAVKRGRRLPNFDDTPEGKAWRRVMSSGPTPLGEEELQNAASQFRSLVNQVQQRTAGDTWTPGDTTQGGNWAPTSVSRTFINVHRLATDFAMALRKVVIPRGVQRLDIPTLTGKATVTIVAPSTGATAFAPQSTAAIVTPSTGVTSFQAKKHGTPVMAANVEEVEDATLAVVDVIAAEGFAALGEALESGILNGQTTGDLTFDVGNGPAPANGFATSDGAAPIGWGLRKYAVAGSHMFDNSGGVATRATILGILAKMGIHGINAATNTGRNEVAVCLSPKVWFDILADTSLESIDIVGALATLPTGALTKIYNANIYVSDEMPDIDASTGKVPASAADSTWAIGVDLKRWWCGTARDAEVRIMPPQLEDVVQVRHFSRSCVAHAPPTTDPSAVLAHNIALAA